MRANWLARKYGAVKIRQDLVSKGAAVELADRVTSDMQEMDKARAILARKYSAPATTREERAKRRALPSGPGFSGDVIRRLVLRADEA